MNLVSLERVVKQHADKLVLDEVTLGIDEGERVGLIGVNGSGKSTLLRIVAGLDQPDRGNVVSARRARIHLVAQEPELGAAVTALDVVVGPGTPAARTLQRFEQASAALRDTPAERGAQERLDAATRDMDAADLWDLEHLARATLDRLGITHVDQPLETMSGGQRKRVALARGLTHAEVAVRAGSTASLLVLDEPTNHLDVDVIEWLEGVLRSRSGALLLVTHDRYLLDRLSTRIIELDRGHLHSHPGTYGDYLEARALREEQAAAAERKRQARLRTELAWLRRSPAARTSKSRARVEAAEALRDADAHQARAELAIDLPARRIGSKVVSLNNIGKSYDGRWVVRGVEHHLKPGDRIGIVGPNGSGKTTLLRLVAGSLEPDEGSVRVGETVHVGWYGQELESVPARLRVVDAVKEVVLETNTVEGITLSASQLLERFLFPPEAQRAYVGELSGGERRRLALLRVLATAPNLLLLDEPTNDLDLDTLAVLEDYLDSWPGTMVVATHDRFFLDRVCNDLFSMEPDGGVRHHPGGWSAYRAREAERRGSQAVRPTEPQSRGVRDTSEARPRRLAYHERRELSSLEKRITDLEQRKQRLALAVQEAGSDYTAAQRSGGELTEVQAEIEEAEARWLELAAIEEA